MMLVTTNQDLTEPMVLLTNSVTLFNQMSPLLALIWLTEDNDTSSSQPRSNVVSAVMQPTDVEFSREID